ncbi:hypothetical protein M431DRAFT_518439 [Trichoderma harzianum CBS 226.95]|uniref:U3 snoRNA associated n=1 Tax=Trichoderma harzianum CBS 226.95 TaxID=983964 RepID=A0A2T4AI18_TRIHA|nr:hypothetical protein M431DRAFT_518439 [Trichoderma harzianum CBS 226.95]PTB56697.1 hypothetical protein M431DRAFT_518439 [Trichoderma harzianum CBS 226.95]
MVVQTRRRKALQEAEEPTKSSPARKMPVREKEDDADVPAKATPAKATPAKRTPAKKTTPAKETPAKETPVKGTLMVFDDEDESEFQTPVGKEDESEYKTPTESNSAPKAAEVEDEEEDSDDEAPEAVSTTKAAEDIKKSAQAAQKAAQEQAASLKRKRQQRDELLKKQAEERKKAEEAKPQNDQPEARQTKSDARARKRTEKSQIPTVLPAEFLTDSSSEDEADDSTEVAAGPKRRKVAGVEKRLTRLDAGPKDEVVKSTVYRVAKKTDERMAPKLKKHTKSSKELLLKRNRPAAAKAGTGFFKRK